MLQILIYQSTISIIAYFSPKLWLCILNILTYNSSLSIEKSKQQSCSGMQIKLINIYISAIIFELLIDAFFKVRQTTVLYSQVCERLYMLATLWFDLQKYQNEQRIKLTHIGNPLCSTTFTYLTASTISF